MPKERRCELRNHPGVSSGAAVASTEATWTFPEVRSHAMGTGGPSCSAAQASERERFQYPPFSGGRRRKMKKVLLVLGVLVFTSPAMALVFTENFDSYTQG